MRVLTQFSNPVKFEAMARAIEPYALGVAIVASVLGLGAGLLFSPADYQQGDTVRIMYVHVPAAWMATMVFTFIAAMSVIAFVWRHSVADIAAKSAALPGAVFTALALFTGAIWGKPTWGAWWVWDARLTSVLVLFFVYIGYMAIWQSVQEKHQAARFARIVALVGFINIPIIKFSVDWWNSLHQPASIVRIDGPTIHASMLTPLFAMIIAYSALFLWLVLSGTRAELLETKSDAKAMRAPRAVSLSAQTKRSADDE